MNFRDERLRGIYSQIVDSTIFISHIRSIRESILNILTPVARSSILLTQRDVGNGRVLRDKTAMMLALIHSAMRSGIHRKTIQILMRKIFLNQQRKMTEYQFQLRHGFRPPSFITISPGKRCNLKCRYCYANATTDEEKLSYGVFSRIINEARENWGTHFFVISGGEPFLWKDDSRDFLDVAEENPDTIFLVYTNGTLIRGGVLDRIYKCGNILPAISVEGLKDITDQRRGRGIFDRIVHAMVDLKKKHTAFGISMTATRGNYKELLSDELINFYFKEMDASFGWIFHYMPIGRDPDPELMPTAEQREWMWRRSWEIIRKDKILLVDFWNHGTVSNGCISAGRPGGYLYIDWNGNIMPCVFFPYSTMNINDVYNNGKTINAIFEDQFFNSIRCWQKAYGYKKNEIDEKTDWLRPCPIRDHHQIAKTIAHHHHARLIDGNDGFIESSKYLNLMERYDRNLSKRIDDLWQEVYVKNHKSDN